MHDDLDGARGIAVGLTLALLFWAVLSLAVWAFGAQNVAKGLLALSAGGVVTLGAAMLAEGRL